MIIHNLQQGTDEWRKIRVAKITGTRFKRLFSSDWLKLVDEIVSERITGIIDESDYESDYMIQGKEREPFAAQAYTEATGIELYTAGFIQSERFPFLGMSPDRIIIGPDAKPIAGVEIKCPAAKTHVRYIRQGKLPNEHKKQVWCWFFMDERIQYVDFVSFCPEITDMPLFTFRTTRVDVANVLAEGNAKLLRFQTEADNLYSQITDDLI